MEKTKLKILIVEDESIVARDIKSTLKTFGYEVVGIVASGEEAIEQALQLRPDLVLMDIMLKGDLTGVEAAKKIRHKFFIPVVFLTAYVDEKTLSDAKLSEPFGYIVKPFEDAELHSTIQMAIYRFRLERQLKEREHLLATILKSISEGVIVTDHQGKISFLNSEAINLTGFCQEEAVGKNVFEIIRILDDKQLGQANQFIQDKIKSANYIQLASQLLINKNNELIPVDVIQNNLLDETESLEGRVFVIHDITKKLEAELNKKETLEQLRAILNGVIQAMAFTVEKRDPYTAGHQKRVSDLARAIAIEMALKADAINAIRLAGLVHDIGKIAIPAEILSKPGRLSSLEFNLIKKHPLEGYEILKPIEFPWPIAQIVLQHHERLDGSGYPAGLKADQILRESRIIAIADVVEAMISHRPYRPSLSIASALEEIKTGSGTKYDPLAAATCLDLFMKKRFEFR